jgi:hypothetical protein
MFKIEKKVPTPPKPTNSRAKYPWREMDIGDSFFVPCKKEDMVKFRKSLGACACAPKLKPLKFTVRYVDGGVRVWRVK